MNREIPYIFNNVFIASAPEKFSASGMELNRLDVGVFHKYENENYSYITDEMAESLIKSAESGNTPLVGLFDPQTSQWASHSSPLVNRGYGYVSAFKGWEKKVDTDGIERDYAIFTVVLFNDYYDEANLIVGQNQSMELDRDSITGEWCDFNGQDYYVYRTARIKGLCVIGEHTPCFSQSKFLPSDFDLKSGVEQFSAALSELREQVNNLIDTVKGGEKNMENENKPTSEFENEQNNPEVNEPEVAPKNDELQEKFDNLQRSYDELTANFQQAEEKIKELESNIAAEQEKFASLETERNALKASISDYESKITSYEQKITEYENANKNSIIEKYSKVVSEEEIKKIKESFDNLSAAEIESRLAITFSNEQIKKQEFSTPKVKISDPPETEFALMMKNYKKK